MFIDGIVATMTDRPTNPRPPRRSKATAKSPPPAPPGATPADRQLARLRGWRNRPESAAALAEFLPGQFRNEVERPLRQFASLGAIWSEILRPDLLPRTRLESLSRGVLRVAVDSSATLYDLDRELRAGLERELIKRHKGPAFRRVQLFVQDAKFWDKGGGARQR